VTRLGNIFTVCPRGGGTSDCGIDEVVGRFGAVCEEAPRVGRGTGEVEGEEFELEGVRIGEDDND
jgi:hypothetical protein